MEATLAERVCIQVGCPAGRFDLMLMPAECNSQMFELLGTRVISPLYKVLHEEDIPRVEKALERCKQDPENAVEEYVRVSDEEGNYDTHVMNVLLCVDCKNYYIKLKNLALTERLLKEAENESELQRTFLTILGGHYFVYKPETDMFTIFWMDYEQKVEVFSMPLAEWEEKMLAENRVTDKDADVFKVFCKAVKKASGEQVYTFRGSIFAQKSEKEAYRVKFQPRNLVGEPTVVGVLSIINEQTGEVMEDYTKWMNLDSQTKTLHKKAISSYAEMVVEQGEEVSIIMVDIDYFKSINDTYGHPFGDQVIVAVADVIKKVVGDHGVAGRVGGDEFMVVLRGCNDELTLRNFLRGIRTNVEGLFQEKLENNRISCSIGVSRSGVDGDNFKDLYHIADKALYIAKQKGKNRYVIYKPEMHSKFNIAGDEQDMQEILNSFCSEKNLSLCNSCLMDLVIHGTAKLPELLKQIAVTFGAGKAIVVWGQPRAIVGAYMPDYDVNAYNMTAFDSPEYQALFEGDMLLLRNTSRIEFTLSDAYAALRDNDALSLLQYRLRDAEGNVAGIVTLEEKGAMPELPEAVLTQFKHICQVLNAVLLREEL